MAINKATVVGTFILGALVLTVGAILFFGGSHLFSDRIRAVAYFQGSVAGLEVGAPVSFRGVRIGEVTQVSVVFSPSTTVVQIPVIMEINRSKIIWEGREITYTPERFKGLVAAGLRAQLDQPSLITGQLDINLNFRPDQPAHLVGARPDLPEIPTVPSDFERLKETLSKLRIQELVNSAQRTLDSVHQLAAHLDTVVDPLSGSIRRTADTATHTLQTADDAIRDLHSEASVTLHSITGLSDDAQRQVNLRGADLGRTIVKLDATATKAAALLDSLNGMVAPRADVRADLESTARDLAASASSLRSFSQTLERNPSALLSGSTK